MNNPTKSIHGVTTSLAPCAGSAEDGWWMSIDEFGCNLASREDRAEALAVGIEIAERRRGAVCGFRV